MGSTVAVEAMDAGIRLLVEMKCLELQAILDGLGHGGCDTLAKLDTFKNFLYLKETIAERIRKRTQLRSATSDDLLSPHNKEVFESPVSDGPDLNAKVTEVTEREPDATTSPHKSSTEMSGEPHMHTAVQPKPQESHMEKEKGPLQRPLESAISLVEQKRTTRSLSGNREDSPARSQQRCSKAGAKRRRSCERRRRTRKSRRKRRRTRRKPAYSESSRSRSRTRSARRRRRDCDSSSRTRRDKRSITRSRSRRRATSDSRSPSIRRRAGSPTHLDRRRITSARKRPVPYVRIATPSSDSSPSCYGRSVGSRRSLSLRARAGS